MRVVTSKPLALLNASLAPAKSAYEPVFQKPPKAQIMRPSSTALRAMMPMLRPGAKASTGRASLMNVRSPLELSSPSEKGSFMLPTVTRPMVGSGLNRNHESLIWNCSANSSCSLNMPWSKTQPNRVSRAWVIAAFQPVSPGKAACSASFSVIKPASPNSVALSFSRVLSASLSMRRPLLTYTSQSPNGASREPSRSCHQRFLAGRLSWASTGAAKATAASSAK